MCALLHTCFVNGSAIFKPFTCDDESASRMGNSKCFASTPDGHGHDGYPGSQFETLCAVGWSDRSFALVRRAADAAKIELYAFRTVTLADQQFFDREHGRPACDESLASCDCRPTTGRSSCQRLSSSTDRVGSGSGGITGSKDHWAREFNHMGIATFIVDGFTPRGILSTDADQS